MVPTVLVVDDSETGRGMMRRMLEQSELGLRVLEAKDGAEALPVALSGDVDIVISDVVMPNLDGIGLLRGIRQKRDADALPVILVTSQDDEERRALSFEAGASDYVSRPFSVIELVSRVQVQLRLRRLQQELRRATERFRRLGSHDELTGLVNRRHLFDLTRRELARSRRHALSLTVAVVDIDHFRQVNARVGPLVGDAIITEMAAILEKGMRVPDVLARIGGEKFAVLLPQTEPLQGRLVCDRLCAAVRSHVFPSHAAGEISVAIGYACYPSGNLESVDELVNAAESALDRAKEAGGSRVWGWGDA